GSVHCVACGQVAKSTQIVNHCGSYDPQDGDADSHHRRAGADFVLVEKLLEAEGHYSNPSSRYVCSFRCKVRRLIPSFLAASVRLPWHSLRARIINSFS